MSSTGMARLTLSLLSHLLSVTIFFALVAIAIPPPNLGWKPSRGSGKDSGKPLRGSQVYLQDPWIHEHNYFSKQDHGPHKHGWGWGASAHSGGSYKDPADQATYVQQLYPVLHIGSTLKRLSSTLQSLKPSHHFKWSSPAFAFFGADGSPHAVGGWNGGGGGHGSQGSHGPGAGGTYETDGWSYNHASHHIGHTVPKKPSYNTW